MLNQLSCELSRRFPGSFLQKDEPMSRHTTFRVGGNADLFFCPGAADEVQTALSLAREAGVPACVIGNGSNLLVRDGGIRGLVICLGDGFSRISADGNRLTAQAGAPLSVLSREAQKRSLSGLAFAAGIPGTVGGGVAMNAGAYGGQLSDVLCRALVLEGDETRWWSCEEMAMGYRTTEPLRRGAIVLEAEFELTPGVAAEILAEMQELNRRRREKQPLHLPSAGSTFKRPEGHFAGALIEQAGLKGARVGGAQVSELHAGFIVNTGNATAQDILSLIARVQSEVFTRFGVQLEPEVRIVGEP